MQARPRSAVGSRLPAPSRSTAAMNVVPAVWIPYPRPAASVELRCGVLYSGCQCVKRDGLQQDCPRTECQGRPSCLDYPAPTCVPSGNAARAGARGWTTGDTAQADAHAQNPYSATRRRRALEGLSKGYVERPPVHPRDNIPCRVHRRGE